jgi:hypothetical protein
LIMTDLDNNIAKVTFDTLYAPPTKTAIHKILLNSYDLTHNDYTAFVDGILTELSDFLKAYSGNDKTRAIEDFFKPFGQQITFDGGLNNAAAPAATNVASAPVPAATNVAATNVAVPAVDATATNAVPDAAETDAFKKWLLNLINERLAYDGKTVINIDRNNAVLNTTCPQTIGKGLGESHSFLMGALNGLGSPLSDKFKIDGVFDDGDVSVMNNSHIMINNGKAINTDLFKPKDSTKPIELSDYVIFKYTTTKLPGSNKYQIPPTTFKANDTTYYRTGIVYHVKSSNDAKNGEINHYTTLLGIDDQKYYIDDDKVYKIKGNNDNISIKLISPKLEVDAIASADNADNAVVAESLNMSLDYIKTVIEGDYLPELVFYKKSGAIPYADPSMEAPNPSAALPQPPPIKWNTKVIPLENPGTNSCFINAVIQNFLYDQALYKVLGGVVASNKKGGKVTRRKSNRRKSKRSKSKRTRKI